MKKEKLLQRLKGGLIVSCQALEDEPLHSSFIMSRMALAAKLGGSVAIRANSVEDINAIKEVVDLPIIGLIKADYPNTERYITPTLIEIDDLIAAGVDVIAMDATRRLNSGEMSYQERVSYIHQHGILVMGDVATLEEGIDADLAGFDFISTTLSGYTPYSTRKNGPDFKLMKQLSKHTKNAYIIAEGRIETTKQLKKALKTKPFAVVIGGAITRPQAITKRFADFIKNNK